MTPAQLLTDFLERVRDTATVATDGLSEDQLADRPSEDAIPIAWLVWHLARVQDDHVADVAGTEQVWTSQDWSARFALPFDDDTIGYGQSSGEVGQVRASADLLTGYLRAVHEASVAYVAGLAPNDLDRVVDERWDPPVTLGIRLVSLIDDGAQHAGQAAYVRGLLGR